ncbi:GNAT family N-acetyltransferase [Undibacterium sp. SXout7W]|uniref:GNAT family N-acetyltransferase n=1 Tax=Undibacterium sp. SXout7W TaxID=3413049 RepID=UPI003BF0182C
MTSPQLIVADLSIHRELLIAMNVEYLSWVFREMEQAFGIQYEKTMGMSADEYVPTVIDKVCGQSPPEGIFYLLSQHGNIVGMGGLRRLSQTQAEIKRIYLRSDCRGTGLGQQLLERLIADARQMGYTRVCLDTAPFMKSAQRLYTQCGFADCSPYEGTEVAPEFQTRWRFMARVL